MTQNRTVDVSKWDKVSITSGLFGKKRPLIYFYLALIDQIKLWHDTCNKLWTK
jgi:hypothetical protein